MQAILEADYSFTPLEYWRSVSASAREFIKRCLTVDPKKRMTAHEALQHPFVSEESRLALGGAPDKSQSEQRDLLPVIKKNFNARRTLHAAIDTIRAINKLREGGAQGMMVDAAGAGAGSSGRFDPPPKSAPAEARNPWNNGPGGDRMEIDSRGNARGQTEEQILQQQRRIQDASKRLWGS